MAQEDLFDQEKIKHQRQNELMNFIKSDVELYSHYKSGQNNINVGKGFGYTSLIFMGGGALGITVGAQQNGIEGIVPILLGGLSIITGAVFGTVGIIFHVKGKGKVRDVMDYTESQLGPNYGSELKLQSTENGVGLVYSF